MADTLSSESAVGMADQLLDESVALQRCLAGLIAARQLHTVAFSELQSLLSELPPGLSDAIPVEFSPEERSILTEIFSERAANRDPFMTNTDELVSVLGSYVLPWVKDIGLKRRIEAAKDQRYQHLAAWKKRADTPIKLPFKLTIDDKTGRQCSRHRPLLFVVPNTLKGKFEEWFCKGLKKENRNCNLLIFDTPEFSGDIPFSVWAGQLHKRNFAEAMQPYEEDEAHDMADVLFNPDLFAGQISPGSMSFATYVHELKRRTAQWARHWYTLSVSCVHLDNATIEQQWQLARLDLLRPYYNVVRVTNEHGGFRVGPYSDIVKAK